MVEVKELTKLYRGKPAVDRISFEVGEGEVVGFLGPNGAGKSTTMRILSGFLSATSGSARVAGFDVERESIEARRCIGYMPEDVPLYEDMRVSEYLRFRACLKGLEGDAMRRRVGEVVELCGLREWQRALIGVLSKGYRQRVALADAFVHEPKLLILDEPTNGLDPNQIRQVREMIRELGRNHTILLSTHILPEVEMTCGRVIILDGGRIKASGRPSELSAQLRGGMVTAEIKGNPDQVRQALEGLSGVKKVEPSGEGPDWYSYRIGYSGDADLRCEVFRKAAEQRWELRELTKKEATLEEVFADLTQMAARA